MKLVVADTTPLNYLVLIGHEGLLGKLFDFVVIPDEVHRELLATGSPDAVSKWARSMPAWSAVQSCTGRPETELDPGEEAAILLAQELNVGLLLMDERKGRLKAQSKGISVVGTIGVLIRAAEICLIDLDSDLDRLEATSAVVSQEIFAHARGIARRLRQADDQKGR